MVLKNDTFSLLYPINTLIAVYRNVSTAWKVKNAS